MIPSTKQSTPTIFLMLLLVVPSHGGDWSNSVEVRYDVQKCVSYRARLSGEFLVIEATHEAGWHTYAMDNKQRAQEKLAGKKSLGIDRPTEIELAEGLTLTGSWYQTPPKDLSKPELRWYTWGFEGQSLFAAKVKRIGSGPASITVRGQACAEATCKNIEISIPVPLTGSKGEVNLRSLVQVR